MHLKFDLQLILIIILAPLFLTAQDYCNSDFTTNEFSSIQKVELQYGRAEAPRNNFNVDSVELDLDLYFSTENTNAVQPIMFLLHGGSFITEAGNKGDMEEIARLMVSKGFVVASISYRTWSIILGGVPFREDIVDVVVKAMLDLQTAIDFVVDVNGTGDFPEVDVNHIVIGGASAGAVTINHRLYIDAQDSLPDFLSTAFENNGGLFESDSEKYEIVYGLNMSGGIFDTAWIDAGEPPLISIHGDKDSVVYYDYGLANGVIGLYGSKPMDERLTEKGVDSYLYTFEGGGHSNIYDNIPLYRDPLLKVLDTGLMKIQESVCLTTNNPLAIVTADVKLVNTLVGQELIVENRENNPMRYQIIDLWGRTIQSGELNQGRQQISFNSTVSGYFVFRVHGQKSRQQAVYQQLFYNKKP